MQIISGRHSFLILYIKINRNSERYIASLLLESALVTTMKLPSSISMVFGAIFLMLMGATIADPGHNNIHVTGNLHIIDHNHVHIAKR